jgi:hypothetical protein
MFGIRVSSALGGLVLLPALLAAETFKITIDRQARLGTAVLQPGDYKVSVDNGKADFQRGKEMFSAKVTEEKLPAPATQSFIRYTSGENQIAEIVFRNKTVSLHF